MPLRRIASSISVVIVCVATACGEGTTEPALGSATGQLSVGEQTACAINAADKALYCWGQNSAFFEYGVDPAILPISGGPVRVSAPPLVSLANGVSQHMCGESATGGTFYCWGRGGNGQLGTLDAEAIGNTYVTIAGSFWRVVTVSRLTSCGVTTLGTGLCWGSNQRGVLGTTAVAINANSSMPVPVDGGLKFTMIAAGWLHSCGITTDGQAMCWGDNQHGQLGIGTIDPTGTPADAHRVPVAVATTQKFLMLSSGALQTCGITTNNRAMCWGDNETGQLGDGTTTDRGIPTFVSTDLKFKMISIGSGFRGGASVPAPSGVSQGGGAHTCALTTAGDAYCWGLNSDGQIGDGTSTDRTTPVAVSSSLPFSTIGAGGAFTCAMRGNQVSCWGSNALGQLGHGMIGSNGSSFSPITVAAPFK